MTDSSATSATESTIAAAKQHARQQAFSKRSAITGSVRLSASQSVANHFADHPYLTYAASFAGYYPIRDELDVLPIFNRMAAFHKQMALPHIQSTQPLMTFKSWTPGQPLDTGAHGIKTTAETAPDLIPEVVLVPLLAFNPSGYRLGYGGGYYDRVIAHYRTQGLPTRFFGVAYALQEDTSFPVDAHDQPLDGILTEEGVSMFHRQSTK